MRDFNSTHRIADLVDDNRPICYGVLKPGDYFDQGVPLVRIVDLEGDKLEEDKLFKISEALDREFIRSKLEGGEILLSIQGTIGRVVIAPPSLKGANISRTIARLAIKEEYSSEFIRFMLLSEHGQRMLRDVVMGTTRDSLNIGALREIEISLPHLEQQRRIAEILSTLDEAIAHTEALIAKHQQIKAGLMHDLFTRGVTPDGHLRPTREQAPDLYKESLLGWIPKEWRCELLDDLATRGSGHTPNKNFPEYWNGGIKWISLADSCRLDRLYISETEYEISQLGIQNSSAVVHPAGIVVLSRDAGVGKSAITTQPMAVSQHFMCWRCDGRLNRYFLYYWLQFKKRMFENIAMGSTILTIGLPYFKRLKIAAPIGTEEQNMIGDCLRSADETIFSLEADLAKEKQQKHGLMHDLLTGKVSVQQ